MLRVAAGRNTLFTPGSPGFGLCGSNCRLPDPGLRRAPCSALSGLSSPTCRSDHPSSHGHRELYQAGRPRQDVRRHAHVALHDPPRRAVGRHALDLPAVPHRAQAGAQPSRRRPGGRFVASPGRAPLRHRARRCPAARRPPPCRSPRSGRRCVVLLIETMRPTRSTAPAATASRPSIGSRGAPPPSPPSASPARARRRRAGRGPCRTARRPSCESPPGRRERRVGVHRLWRFGGRRAEAGGLHVDHRVGSSRRATLPPPGRRPALAPRVARGWAALRRPSEPPGARNSSAMRAAVPGTPSMA